MVKILEGRNLHLLAPLVVVFRADLHSELGIVRRFVFPETYVKALCAFFPFVAMDTGGNPNPNAYVDVSVNCLMYVLQIVHKLKSSPTYLVIQYFTLFYGLNLT